MTARRPLRAPRAWLALAVLLAVPASAGAAAYEARTYDAGFEDVWTRVHAALAALQLGEEESARSRGEMTTRFFDLTPDQFGRAANVPSGVKVEAGSGRFFFFVHETEPGRTQVKIIPEFKGVVGDNWERFPSRGDTERKLLDLIEKGLREPPDPATPVLP